MAFTITPNKDIEPLNDLDSQRNGWKSKGEDPAFLLKYGFIRAPYVVIEISSLDAHVLDPKIYLDRGRGFREADSVSLPAGRNFVVKLDVGRIGNIRSLRVDPRSGAGSFRFSAKAFQSPSEAEGWIAELRETNSAGLFVIDNGPRFGFRLLGRSSQKHFKPKDFANATYGLASKVPPNLHLEDDPWLSVVVPVYNAPARYLEDLIGSFERQDQHGWELILSDDASTSVETIEYLSAVAKRSNVVVIRNARNGGIAVATNSGLEKARGRWISFVDHDDLLAPHALKIIRRSLDHHPDAQFLYTDELVVDEKLKAKGVMLKPAYDPVLLSGVNYINHMSFYRGDRLKEIGYLRTGYDGSQDYDLLLRYLDGLDAREVLHLPYPAYWWRRSNTTYSRTFLDSSTANARKAITESFGRRGVKVSVGKALTETLHHPVFEIDTWPKLSIIIPSINSPGLIARILEDLYERTDYPDFEVVVVDNGTTDSDTLGIYDRYRRERGNFIADITPGRFNFSRSVNRGRQIASGEHFLVLNNDVEVIDAGWLKEMVSCLLMQGTGIVGAKLLFPDRNIQHAGVMVGFGGLAGHWYLNRPADYGGPMNRLHVRNSMTCVTGAVMLISGKCWSDVGSWDEKHFAIAYNDVDYCMRARRAGYRIIWTPFACLYHHESASRGAEVGETKRARFDQEKQHLRNIHETQGFDDPASNPNYTKDRSVPSLCMPQFLHEARTS